MALEKLVFTKVWTDHNDFPTIQNSEAQVRADLQLLHDEAKTAINNIVDELEESGAADIGATATGRTSTNVQGIINELNVDVTANTTASHTHSNKALLDTYTQTEANLADAVSKKHSHANKAVLDLIIDTVKQQYDRLVTVFTGVTRVVTTLTSLDTDIPTAKAVTDAMAEAGNGDMMKAAYATQSSTKVDTAINAENFNGEDSDYYATAAGLAEVSALLSDKADLDSNSKVPVSQIPSLNYIPTPVSQAISGQVLTWNGLAYAPANIPTPATNVFYAGTSEPSNTKLLWIDTTDTTGGLKYHNGSEWVTVPVRFS